MKHAHVTPIYQASTFGFPDVQTMQSIFAGESPGYVYSRCSNPNVDQIGGKYAGVKLLESVQIPTFAVSLGNVDSLIEHPA